MSASPFAMCEGAVIPPGRSTPAHYGNPFTEQRALLERGAIVDLSDHGVVEVTGDDRLTWLNSLTSQALTALAPGESTEALLLDATGHIEHVLRVLDDGVSTWLLVDPGSAVPLTRWLDSMRFRLRVDVSDRSDDLATVGVIGDRELPAAHPHGVRLVWNDGWNQVADGGYQYAEGDHPASQWRWREYLIERTDLPALAVDVQTGELPIAGQLAVDALRVAAWRPAFLTEVDEHSIPHEVDWLRSAVHLNKGCYRGQETVAKVHNLGHPPRRLVLLHLDGSDNVRPETGAPVLSGHDRVGKVTIFAEHYELGPIALALVKRTTDPGATLTVLVGDESIPAAQQIIVPPGAGARANVPRLPRLGAVRRGS